MTRDMDTIKMSYEEMIDTLKGLVFGTFDRTTAKEREALDMAIEALQKEPCEDAISKEDVIKAIDRHTFNTDDGLCLDEDITIILEEVAPKQDSILNKIRAEIEQIEINGHISCAECFRAGVNVALNVIDKYKAESEET